MKQMYVLIVAYLLLSTSSCEKNKPEVSDDTLSLPAQNYIGNEIRIDGYWYLFEEREDEDWFSGNYFLYQDGIIFGGISVRESRLEEREEEYKNEVFYMHNADCKYCWGRFIVNGEEIKFERWYPGQGPLRAYIRSGIILNDTTFRITESYRMQNGIKTEVSDNNETYYFKALSPKPDSTNSFVQ